ncbi:unnamed protein product [Pseudo-nitzschia multistriata]|uniref:Uncharacterized protein n=1 Tax=Pseudo-nitzschia multistriata TaxID=183589 RepID=A0A448Z7V2_9STRA|nr:unnamed protein product [Pseudo-nitzschia multistriata]
MRASSSVSTPPSSVSRLPCASFCDFEASFKDMFRCQGVEFAIGDGNDILAGRDSDTISATSSASTVSQRSILVIGSDDAIEVDVDVDVDADCESARDYLERVSNNRSKNTDTSSASQQEEQRDETSSSGSSSPRPSPRGKSKGNKKHHKLYHIIRSRSSSNSNSEVPSSPRRRRRPSFGSYLKRNDSDSTDSTRSLSEDESERQPREQEKQPHDLEPKDSDDTRDSCEPDSGREERQAQAQPKPTASPLPRNGALDGRPVSILRRKERSADLTIAGSGRILTFAPCTVFADPAEPLRARRKIPRLPRQRVSILVVEGTTGACSKREVLLSLPRSSSNSNPRLRSSASSSCYSSGSGSTDRSSDRERRRLLRRAQQKEALLIEQSASSELLLPASNGCYVFR